MFLRPTGPASSFPIHHGRNEIYTVGREGLIKAPGSKRRKGRKVSTVRAKKVTSVRDSLRRASPISPDSMSLAKSSSCAPGAKKA